jgi:drug/metabolite transporter (DMT)-like permease
MVVGLALLSAFFIGLSHTFLRKGLGGGSLSQAVFFSLLTNAVILWAIVVFFGNIHLIATFAIFWFLLTGFLGPGIGRTLNTISLKRIGIVRTMPIVGIAPFFGTLGAILFLDERVSIYVFFGIALIVTGIFFLSYKKTKIKKFQFKDITIPLTAAFLGGLSMVATKKGFEVFTDQFLGAALAASMAVVMVFSYIIYAGHTREIGKVSLSNISLFIFSGIAMSAAFSLHFSAFKFGDVAIVAPLLSTFPLFGVLLGRLILKENITKTMWIGISCIVSGVIFVQLL